MASRRKIACLQTNPGRDLQKNLAEIEWLITEAVAQGVELIALPEFATFLSREAGAMGRAAESETRSPALARLQEIARENRVWILVGSIVMALSRRETKRFTNRSFMIAADGAVVAEYDKIHLFDAVLKDGRRVGESRNFRSGDTAPVVRTPLGTVGMSICYDLRFPTLYRGLAQAGAEILAVPSSFTYETGLAHWEILLRCRAIETGSYVIAPATHGLHPGNWRTYGRAMIVDPWGEIVTQCNSDESGFCLAEVDLECVYAVRNKIPSLSTNPEYKIRQSS